MGAAVAAALTRRLNLAAVGTWPGDLRFERPYLGERLVGG
ncbi:hypothetical protein STRTUCAR8_04056 [Streptomyces turgidiscabies Car8]|uniref:Uncharacterized protein n=1 Tax=Streptomyces turgidiscabies (strain Car8) TaxID=698760 RepID=L7F2C6_STRT8|nr:hypothetical protein STRTUCAR8_04056 [Streptomyces turgidiscabies Car8]